jgi:hypothetical protein
LRSTKMRWRLVSWLVIGYRCEKRTLRMRRTAVTKGLLFIPQIIHEYGGTVELYGQGKTCLSATLFTTNPSDLARPSAVRNGD